MYEKELAFAGQTFNLAQRLQMGSDSYAIRKRLPTSLTHRNEETMGWGIEDFLEDIHDIQDAITDGTNHIVEEIGKQLEQIDWSHIGRELENLGHSIGNLYTEMNPYHLVWQGFSTNPITEHMARELDHLTGGALTTVDDISTLTGRTLRGDAISEEELIKDAMFAAKVAAVVISGGSAVAIIGASADQMKQGTLGETELGRAILAVASVAALAYAAGGEVMQAAQREAIRQAMSSAKTEILKHSPLAQTQFGRALIETAFAGATAEMTGGSFSDAATAAAKGQATLATAQEVSKQTGIPVSQGMIEALANAGTPPDASKVDYTKLPKGVSWASIMSAIENISLKALTNITIDTPSGLLEFTDMPTGVLAFEDMPKGVFAFTSDSTPNTSTTKDAPPLIKTKEDVDWSGKEVTPISVAGKDVTLPNPANPEGMAEIIKWWLRLKDYLRGGKKANYKKRIKIGNQNLDVYLMEDGTFEYELSEATEFLLIAGFGLAALLLLLGLTKRGDS